MAEHTVYELESSKIFAGVDGSKSHAPFSIEYQEAGSNWFPGFLQQLRLDYLLQASGKDVVGKSGGMCSRFCYFRAEGY